MAENEIKRVITIESSESLNTLNNLNARIKELKGTMGDLDITTEEYRQVSEEVTQLENVKRNAIRGVTAAVEGSYNAYSKELSILQKHRKTLNENTQEYRDMTKRVAELQQKLKDMDADVGVYSRNVGNYSSAFNGLQFSVNQVVRELPVITMGLDRFMLAISNNLPMLFDSIRAYTKLAEAQGEVAESAEDMAVNGTAAGVANTTVATTATAAATGETAMATGANAATIAVKNLIRAIFSWNTLLMLVIVAMQYLSEKLSDWIDGMKEAKVTIEETKTAMQNLNEAMQSSEIGSTIAKVYKLKDAWDELGDSLVEKEKFIRTNKEAFDQLGIAMSNINEAEEFFSENTEDYIEAMKLRARAAGAMQLAAEKYKEAVAKETELADYAPQLKELAIYELFGGGNYIKGINKVHAPSGNAEQVKQNLKVYEIGKIKLAVKRLNEAGDEFFDLALQYTEQSESRLRELGVAMGLGDNSQKYGAPEYELSFDRSKRLSTSTDWGYEGAVDAAAEQEALKATLEAKTKMLTANAEERKTIEEQLQQELATIEELRLVNHEIILNELLRDEGLTAEERMALEEALTQNKIDQAQLQIKAEEERAKKEKAIKDKEAKEEAEREKQMQRVKADMLNTTTSLIRQSAELFEEDSKERKALNAAAIVMDTYKAAMAAWTAAQGLPPGIGQAVGAANVAASVAMGAMQLANLFKVAPDGSNAEGALSSAQSAPNVASSMPASYTRSLQGDNELTEMNKDTRVYVVESDITNAQKSARVRVESATF